MKGKIFAVYKPKGISSYDVIRKLKKKYQGERIGHGGTLDPLAEGVLVIGVGRAATKKLSFVLKDADKEYVATIELGGVSETDDSEGPVASVKRKVSSEKLNATQIQRALRTFVGEIKQVPPKYSAAKIRGVSAYKRARRGEEFSLKPKKVTIRKIELLTYAFPILKIWVVCGSGVYIRALARDIGEKLKTGGYLKSLVRTRVGEYTRTS